MIPFSITPTESELKSIDRDLRFHPIANDSPRYLTSSQIEHYNVRGYVAPISIFSNQEIEAIRTYFDELLKKIVAAGGDQYSISSAHLKYGPVYDILNDSRIANVVSDLLGENVIGWGSHFFCKLPKDGKAVAWHQDASYWPLSPSKAVTVWLAVDDADRENACMKFVAGSHHVGHLTYRPSDSADHNVLSQSIDNAEQYGDVVWDELKAGQVSIHSDLLLHGSEANESSRRRCGLTLRYCSADVRAAMRWNEKGVYVRGNDASAHWSNNQRPE
ncbi:MAG: phytanoyl-CoA dioxygenase family protein [Pirellulaceae bacterium]|nr:phytanoyl-CoA dioxygenase family protein [Pirellulaceae bacterium]